MKINRLSTDKLVRELEKNDYHLTDNIDHAIYILDDGRMIDGQFYYGSRGLDHNMISCGVPFDRYEKDFWLKVHRAYRIVRLVPESRMALIKVGQRLTPIQKKLIEEAGYQVERY